MIVARINVRRIVIRMSRAEISTSHISRLVTKTLVFFVSGLYLFGFAVFPLLGIGNYVIVRMDFLLPSELILSACLGLGFVGVGIREYVVLVRSMLGIILAR